MCASVCIGGVSVSACEETVRVRGDGVCASVCMGGESVCASEETVRV